MPRRKYCEFCMDDEPFYDSKEGRNGFYIWCEKYPMNNLIAFIAQANTEEGELMEADISIEMNYCPVCGRKWREG